MCTPAGSGSEAASPWQQDSGSLRSSQEPADGRSRRSSRAPSPVITTQFSAAAVATARGPQAAQEPASLAPAAAVGTSSNGVRTQPASSQQASLCQHGSMQRPGHVPMQPAEQHGRPASRLEACGSGGGSGAMGGSLAGSDSLLPAASTLVHTPPGQLLMPLGVQQRTPAPSPWGQQQQNTPASGAVTAAWQRRQLGARTPGSSAAATP